MSRVDSPSKKPAVLVVDDDPALRGPFAALLGREGFAVDCAADGRAAFQCLRRGNYAAILLDLMGPGANGLELLERIERDTPSLLGRVIVLTGAAQPAAGSLDTSRIGGVVRRPFDLDDLLRSTRKCARGAH